ncbi:MAG: arylesterase [Flavobacteriaceae bacterium]
MNIVFFLPAYGLSGQGRQARAVGGAVLALLAAMTFVLAAPAVRAEPVRIVALGDSLTAGYGLPPGEGFAEQLEKALRRAGTDATIVNAGVSGDTAAGGLERLDWAVPEDTQGVILELGANDALRGVDPENTYDALSAILDKLNARDIPVLIAGMRAPPNMGAEYAAAFDGMFERLADEHGALLYPFFLEGVAGDPDLNQPDGLHPNKKGVAEIVSRMVPSVTAFIEAIR